MTIKIEDDTSLHSVDLQDSGEFKLLVVDDDSSILSALRRVFIDTNYRLLFALSADKALELLSQNNVHAALIDLKMPDMSGLELLKKIKNRHPSVMMIMLTAHGTISDAVNAIKNGAIDFIEKPCVPAQLLARVAHLESVWKLKNENQALKTEIAHRFRYEKLLGNSMSMLHLKKMIGKVGISDTTCLIQGETGTGKELVAKAVHHHSFRCEDECIVVDCTTINETMLESELFGHVKGSFTGAHANRKGLVKAGHNGTVFFDEIGELPLQTQSKLLRLIQEKEIRPVGSSKPLSVDVRILAATNRNLEAEVKNGRFREDLFYRLNAVTVQVPPLRERSDDIYLLADHFIQKYTTDYSTVQSMSAEVLSRMENYSWPGNVRELENVVRRLMVLSTNPVASIEDLPHSMTAPVSSGSHGQENSLATYEKEAILNALKICGNHRKKAASILNIGEATLYRKIKKYWPVSN